MKGLSGIAGIVLAVYGCSAVALGAFGAHALRGAMTASQMEVWHAAVQYHFWHTLAFALAAILPSRLRTRTLALWLFAIGVPLFSGSLYALVLGMPRWVGAITPLGGVCFMLGWIALGWTLLHSDVRRHE